MTNNNKTSVESEANNLIGKRFYDLRFEDYFTVNSSDKSGNWLNLTYDKRGGKREATSFVTYHINMQQYLLAKN